MGDFNRSEFIADISSALNDIRVTSTELKHTDPDDKVFTYLVASMFETLDENSFTYTDGSNDKGIDFTIVEDNSFKFYQCKSIDLDVNPNGKVFDATPVNELEEALSFILSPEHMTAKKEVTYFKNSFNLSPNDNSLTAVLAIEGRLSKAAEERFVELKNKFINSNVSIELIDENSFFNKWHTAEDYKKISEISIHLEPISDNSYLRQKNGWIYGIFKLTSLLDAIQKYGDSLFDLNVRSKIAKSSVNDSIRQTISTEKGQKEFIHLNNGLVIQCEHYNIKPDEIKLTGAQVVNGCQTLSTIWKYYLNEADSVKRQNLKDNIQIFIRIFDKSISEKDGLLDKIIVASNNQNSMNRRNLKSNSFEQKEIQRMFYSSPIPSEIKYFYIRKDGEFDSFLENGIASREPRKSLFAIEGSQRKGVNKYRHIDNEHLAQIWWSWIGNSDKVNTGGIKFFEGNIYSNIFEKRPSNLMLDNMSYADYKFNSNDLEAGIPSPYQYLLAMAFSTYFSTYLKPKPNFKKELIERLKQSHDLTGKETREEIAQALSKNLEYTHTIWKGQMSYAVSEVAMFLLSQKYGKLTPDICQKILGFSDVRFWLKNGMNSALVEDVSLYDDSILMNIMAQLIEASLKTFFIENKAAIMIDPRPKLYLSKRENIIQVKKCCLSVNEEYRDIKRGPKKAGSTFLDLFPEI